MINRADRMGFFHAEIGMPPEIATSKAAVNSDKEYVGDAIIPASSLIFF
jgi:hypothetical protein